MTTTDCFVSLVVPLQDDDDIVESFVRDAAGMLEVNFANYELVLVDDASQDRTMEIVRRLLAEIPGLRVVRLSRRFGQETAIAAGLDSAIGDYVVVMLPATDPPAVVPAMVDLARGGSGVVFGMRHDRASDPLLLRLGAYGFFWFVKVIVGLPIPPNATHFRVLSRQAVNAVSRIRHRKRYLRTLTGYVGFGSREFPYQPVARRATPRTKRPFEAIELAIDIVVSNTNRPLRIAALGAAIGSALSGLYAVYAIVLLVLRRDLAEGWVSITAPLGVLFFILFGVLGVMAEYLGEVLEEVKDRPLYHTLDEWISTQPVPHRERRNVVTLPEAP